MTTIVDVLNRERPITRTYPDRSFDCPFCAAAVIVPAPRCENPCCPASAAAMANPACAPAFQQKLDQEEARQREQEERKRNHEWTMSRIKEDNEARDTWISEQYGEARQRGTCLACLKPDPFRRVARFVKHRSVCPIAR